MKKINFFLMLGLLTIPLRALAMLPGPVVDGGWLVENHESVVEIRPRFK